MRPQFEAHLVIDADGIRLVQSGRTLVRFTVDESKIGGAPWQVVAVPADLDIDRAFKWALYRRDEGFEAYSVYKGELLGRLWTGALDRCFAQARR